MHEKIIYHQIQYEMKIMIGCYLLVTKLDKDSEISIGKKNTLYFSQGYYVYVGSALNGLERRIHRHLCNNKKLFWNIDYLLCHARIVEVFYKENIKREECSIAKYLMDRFESVPGFGCSDCSCKSHLFFGTYDEINKEIEASGIKPYSINFKKCVIETIKL
ncbi:MAG: GIY-YIG nuclease family protein [Thermoplasmatota archaeon]